MIRFYDPIYEKTYYFISKDLEKTQKKLIGKVLTDGNASGWFITSNDTAIIYVKGFKKTNSHLATLAHEVNHAVDTMAEAHDVDDTEAKSYYASFLTREVLNGLHKTKKNKVSQRHKIKNKKATNNVA
jgi:hypothetical protein